MLPVTLPFLLGLGISALAEPMTSFLTASLRLPRPLSAGVGVTAVVASLLTLLLLVFGLFFRELQTLSGILPDMEMTVRSGIGLLRSSLLNIIARCPEGFRPLLRENANELFSGSTALLHRLSAYALGMAGSVLTRVPDGALCLGTAVLAGYMISAKLPEIQRLLPREPTERVLRIVRSFRETAMLWLMSQVKLAGVTFLILTAGLLLLRVSYAPFTAFLIALVDAFPVLGTGTVLVPWSVICLLEGERVKAAGILGLYAAASAIRSLLEPRLVGRQIGLDPLVTLAALYIGYRLWGLAGMLLMPMLAASAYRMAMERGE